MGPSPKIIKAKSGRVTWPWWGDLWTSLAAPFITPLPTPGRGPLTPGMALSPVARRLHVPGLGGHTSTYCSWELSIEIFSYLWDKEFIWIKLPLSPGGVQ